MRVAINGFGRIGERLAERILDGRSATDAAPQDVDNGRRRARLRAPRPVRPFLSTQSASKPPTMAFAVDSSTNTDLSPNYDLFRTVSTALRTGSCLRTIYSVVIPG